MERIFLYNSVAKILWRPMAKELGVNWATVEKYWRGDRWSTRCWTQSMREYCSFLLAR